MPETIRSGEALVRIDRTKVTDQVNALFPCFRNVAYLVQMLALKRFFIVIHKKSLAGWRHPKELNIARKSYGAVQLDHGPIFLSMC